MIAKQKMLRILVNRSLLRFAFIPLDVIHSLTDSTDEGEAGKAMQWLFEANTLTEQLIPKHRGYYGPAKEFENLTIAEFHYCELCYARIVEENDESAIDELVACLYRKAKKNYDKVLNSDGDIREAYNGNEVAHRVKKVKHWPMRVKLAILFFYDGCREAMKNVYDEVFAAGNNESAGGGMFGVIRGIAGTKYGDFEKVEQLNVHTIFMEIEEILRENEEIKRQYNL